MDETEQGKDKLGFHSGSNKLREKYRDNAVIGNVGRKRRDVSSIGNDTVFATVHWPRYFYNWTDARRESEAVVSRVIIRRAFTRVIKPARNCNSSIPSWRPARSRFRSRAVSRSAYENVPREKLFVVTTEKTRSVRLLRFSMLSNRRSISSFSAFDDSVSFLPFSFFSHESLETPLIISECQLIKD